HQAQDSDRHLVGGVEDHPAGLDLEQQPHHDVRRGDQNRCGINEQRRAVGTQLDIPDLILRRRSHDRARRSRKVSAAVRAAPVAWAPLSSADVGSPARARACSSVLVVNTPLATGVDASSATRVSPWVTESQTYSKCGVSPRITTPRAMTASWLLASCCATTGSSIAPSTRTTVGSSMPDSAAALRAPASSASQISVCQVLATMP